MQTKLEKLANQLWQTHEASSPAFWQKYEYLLKSSKNKIIGEGDSKLPVVNSSGDIFYESKVPTTLLEIIIISVALLLVSCPPCGILTGIISQVLDLSNYQTYCFFLSVLVIVFLISLYFFLIKVNDDDELITTEKLVLNFALNHITIEQNDETKKIYFKHLSKVQYQKHCFTLTAKFPNHGDREYTIPLFDSKGHKLPQAQVKHIYKRLKIAVQYNQ
ncbi:hypothetical protein BKI52_45095 [marine bacterium AO1-C]|nr:hypothetical protein BKI52_45095 [marine bacterium AO1-C]